MDEVRDLMLFSKLTYENKTLYFKFYQVLLKQQEIFNERFCFSLTWLSSKTFHTNKNDLYSSTQLDNSTAHI